MRLLQASTLGLLLTVSGGAFAQQWSASVSNSGYSYSGPASGKGIDNIGNAGQWVFGVERVTAIAFERQSRDYDDANTGQTISDTTKTTTLNLFGAGANTVSTLPRLALDFLPLDNVSVGLSAVLLTRSVSIAAEGNPSVTSPVGALISPDSSLSFLGNLRAGYAFPFDETFGLWGRGGIAYGYESADFEIANVVGTGVSEFTITRTSIDVTLDVMAVLSPFKHFVIMGGPFLDLGIGGAYTVENSAGDELDDRNAKLTAFGLTFAVSGYY